MLRWDEGQAIVRTASEALKYHNNQLNVIAREAREFVRQMRVGDGVDQANGWQKGWGAVPVWTTPVLIPFGSKVHLGPVGYRPRSGFEVGRANSICPLSDTRRPVRASTALMFTIVLR